MMLNAGQVLDNYFLETRSMLLEIAATLDRYDRASSNDAEGGMVMDSRLEKIYDSLAMLSQPQPRSDRSEALLNLFSDLD